MTPMNGDDRSSPLKVSCCSTMTYHWFNNMSTISLTLNIEYPVVWPCSLDFIRDLSRDIGLGNHVSWLVAVSHALISTQGTYGTSYSVLLRLNYMIITIVCRDLRWTLMLMRIDRCDWLTCTALLSLETRCNDSLYVVKDSITYTLFALTQT